eukprot:TRINITY_DN2867_c0_g1_i5.p1 TRINITY_DN2867_c0_g1~~TRINITY_DN2867_c0_g1_i5.p1  ORF type:complete len:242 (-),score=78.57 TRINITY_DN2867_c0_g1_i5:187-912(-)
MNPDEAIKVFFDKTIPEALNNLKEAQKTLETIAQYCREAKKKDDYDASYQQTEEYTKDALMNVAYHVHTVGTHFTSFLQLQDREIDKISIKLSTLTARLNHHHTEAATQGYKIKEAQRFYTSISRSQKLDDSSLPESSKLPPTFSRHKITLDSLDQMNLLVSFSPDAEAILAPPPSLTPIHAKISKTKKSKKSIKGGRKTESDVFPLPEGIPPPPPPDFDYPPPPPPDEELPPPPPPPYED